MNREPLAHPPVILNVGLERLATGPRAAGAVVTHLDWRPPGDGDPALACALARLASDARTDAANDAAVARMLAARPHLVDVALRAADIWPHLWTGGARTLTHAGAPLTWEAMCEPMKGTLIGAMLYEGWAADEAQARARLAAGGVRFVQNHDLGAVAPMSGTISPSMPLFVVRDTAHGTMAYSNLSEGIGPVLRFGAFGPEVIAKLRWLGATVAPALKAALAELEGGVDLRSIQSQALLMGDEVHSRNAAATALFHMAIGGALAGSAFDRARSREVLDFIAATSQFFLNLSMAAAKSTMDAAHGIAHASIVTAIARNGVTTAIRVSGLGPRWFEAPSDIPVGLFFPGFAQGDANPDLGDSAICETAGYGGQAIAAAPALLQLVGGTVADAIAISRETQHIAWARNPDMALPNLDFSGAPAGIDVRKVVDNALRPLLTTGIAHRRAGIGQIGAGMVRVPMACFTQALRALADHGERMPDIIGGSVNANPQP